MNSALRWNCDLGSFESVFQSLNVHSYTMTGIPIPSIREDYTVTVRMLQVSYLSLQSTFCSALRFYLHGEAPASTVPTPQYFTTQHACSNKHLLFIPRL